MRRAPFPPLLANGAALRIAAEAPEALARRMAEIYGVAEDEALPVRGRLHGVELIFRMIAIGGSKDAVCEKTPETERLAAIARIALSADRTPSTGAVIAEPDGDMAGAVRRASEIAPALLVIDESDIEFSDISSAAPAVRRAANLIIIRSLESAYGLAGAPCAALIGATSLIARLKAVIEPLAVPPAIADLALAALDPVRMGATRERIESVMRERARVCERLGHSSVFSKALASIGPQITAVASDIAEIERRARAWRIDIETLGEGVCRLPIGLAEENDRLLAAFGARSDASPARRGEAVRETRETRIVASVDLDRCGAPMIDTGVGFFDHMLAQIAQHGGISITLSCCGDLDVDTHHTIEDCAIALGQALKTALGERRGVARYGFTLPMDEAEASVSIDLGGRPFLVFDGAFRAPLIGRYPTEMTEHVFRSLSESLGAAIHIRVSGENDHHKTEACFKAFARALRQAVRIESDETPSTKGAIL